MYGNVLDWYHYYLCHPGKTRMYKTIVYTIYWENIEKDIISTMLYFHMRKSQIDEYQQAMLSDQIIDLNVNEADWNTQDHQIS